VKTIVTILGARPQFVKASAVSSVIGRTAGLREVLVHTGQHFDANMSDVFFAELGIRRPAHCLEISGGTHGAMTARMLQATEQVLLAERPDAVLVYGDTNSTLAGALAAVKLHIPVAHVEAGLRSFNMRMPEEVNRILVDRVSDLLFTPTQGATENLLREGVPRDKIHQVGDVMFDVSLQHGGRMMADIGLLARLGYGAGQYILVTIHRAENTDVTGRLHAIVDALIAVSAHTPIVLPLHPRTRAALEKVGRLEALEACVRVVEPLGYLDMVQLERHAALIATDSGGVQKEAFFFGVPCVTLRDETEWVELVEAGWNRVAPPTDAASLQAAIETTMGTRGAPVSPYGDGEAAERIVAALRTL
jgi:UDP-GlcNAc3NAcA epimerase